MGITGLIPFVEKASRQIDLEELSGCTVAIDAYCWLHRGVIAVAEKLSRGENTHIHIQYCMKQVNHLTSRHIRPILVFDGRHLAAKAGVEAERRESRKAAKEKAKALIAAGKKSEARSYLQRSLNISHSMALELIKSCHARGIDCIVAPYEADGQLAYLNLSGIADCVITEDSDLLLFGCKKVLFKFSAFGGLLVEADKLHLTLGVRKEKFTFDKFRQMCILSGCDYLPSLPGIGLAKAKKFILMTEETDMRRALGKIPSYLGLRQVVVTDEYKEGFLKAEATFKFMVVYNPKERKLTRLNEIEEGIESNLLSNSGDFFDEEEAFELALGNIDPMSMKRVHDWNPDMQDKRRVTSIWGNNNKENASRKLKTSVMKQKEEQEKDVQNEHLKSIKIGLYSTHDESDVKIEEVDFVSSYFDTDLQEPPKKILRSNTSESSRKSSNIFRVKTRSVDNPRVKSPLKSPNQCNVSLIASIASTEAKMVESPSKSTSSKSPEKTLNTPSKDLFALARQRTEEIVSPEAFKLLKTMQEKLQQPQKRRIRTQDEIKTSPVKTNMDFNSTDSTSTVSLNEDSDLELMENSSTKEAEDSAVCTPNSIEPSVIIIEDNSPIKLKPPSQTTVQTKKLVTRPSGLTKRKGGTKPNTDLSQQMRLSHFGFIKNKV